ncbi:MAG: hypothetical protein ACI8W8_004539 [Rhodothermales bacterium]|jgi:hypothetical protein
MKYALFILLCLPGFVGCVHLDQELIITSETKGKFLIRASIDSNVYQAFIKRGNSAVTDWFDPVAGSKWISEADGAVVDTYRVYERDGRQHLKIEGLITDLPTFIKSGKTGAFELSKRGGNHRLKLRLKAPSGQKPARALGGEEVLTEKLAAIAQGMRLDLTITVPQVVTATTAPFKKGTSVKWIFDVDKDPSFLSDAPEISVEYQ